jgi:6-phosphogluconolactonase (cycloisomerase 2 family)
MKRQVFIESAISAVLILLGVSLSLQSSRAQKDCRTTSAGATKLFFVEMEQDGLGSVEGLDGAHFVAVSPDGKHVYVTGNSDNAVVVFGRDGATGEIAYVEMYEDGTGGVDGLEGASAVVVSPDGKHVYVTGDEDHAVAAFARDGTTGKLSFVEMEQDGVGIVDGLRGAASVAVSPNGAHVYVAGYIDDAVAVFGRDASTGGLSFIEMQTNGAFVSGLWGALSVAVSPDGKHVYVAGKEDDAVTAFERNVNTGQLTYLGTVWNSDPTVDGLDGVFSVSVAPDGKHVYTASYIGDAVAVFERNANTGALTFIEVHKDGENGVDGLNGGSSVAVAPDGNYVYIVGYYDNAMAVFERDEATGRLEYREVHRDGVGGVDGLDGVQSVTVSPDGAHVYTTGFQDDAATVFAWRFPAYLPLVLKDSP